MVATESINRQTISGYLNSSYFWPFFCNMNGNLETSRGNLPLSRFIRAWKGGACLYETVASLIKFTYERVLSLYLPLTCFHVESPYNFLFFFLCWRNHLFFEGLATDSADYLNSTYFWPFFYNVNGNLETSRGYLLLTFFHVAFPCDFLFFVLTQSFS